MATRLRAARDSGVLRSEPRDEHQLAELHLPAQYRANLGKTVADQKCDKKPEVLCFQRSFEVMEASPEIEIIM